MAATASAETVAAAAAAVTSGTLRARIVAPSFLSFCRRARLPGAVGASTYPRRCHKDDHKASAAIDDDVVPDVSEPTWDDLVLCCKVPDLVEFWAPWCGPCRLMHPVIADLANAYKGRLRCFKLNTDKNQDVATRHGIRSIPTILIFKNGERKETVIGAVADSTLATMVERFL